MNFEAANFNVIDYQNMNAGFIFSPECNHQGAAITGDILFDQVSFSQESDIVDRYKTGGLIYSSSVANLTITNSIFNIHHRELEDFNVFEIEDSSICSFDDDIIQRVTFANNSVTFNNKRDKVFQNIDISFTSGSTRTKEISITDNIFYEMNGAMKSFLKVVNQSPGTVKFEGNTVSN